MYCRNELGTDNSNSQCEVYMLASITHFSYFSVTFLLFVIYHNYISVLFVATSFTGICRS